MQVFAARTVFVCLTAAGLFGSSGAGAEAGPPENWNTVHAAALEASNAGRGEEGLKLFLASWRAAETPEQQAISAEEIGFTLHHNGSNAKAKEWLERSRALCLTLPGRPHLSAIDSGLADIARDSGDYPAAERLWRSVIPEAAAEPGGDSNVKVAVAQLGLADLLCEQGRIGEAAALFSNTLALADIAPRQRLDALLGLADIDRGAGAWQASIDQWNKAVELARMQGDVRTEAVALRGMGLTWLDAGVPARAEPLLRRSLSLVEANPAIPPEQTAGVFKSLGEFYAAENKLLLAEEAFSQALSIERRALGEDHPQVAELMENLSWIYGALGEIDRAKDLASRAWTVMLTTFGADSLPVASALANRAFLEVEAKDLKAAAADYGQAVDIARHHPDCQRVELALIQRYKEVLKALHRDHEAMALNNEARLISNNLKVSPLR